MVLYAQRLLEEAFAALNDVIEKHLRVLHHPFVGGDGDGDLSGVRKDSDAQADAAGGGTKPMNVVTVDPLMLILSWGPGTLLTHTEIRLHVDHMVSLSSHVPSF
eukprot:CAMPEP_0196751556 /NCGR_PEP_ID=MMETSP1091-20130531/84083_1 /TAXON_ID=302021 /ORGANISM="Rhodomonas sp., Strain CCMP768" /LENGTH=103 /DNA_ID=CAMNT_0042099359 /DNA_START=69 /DNA_END=378 /DNA_ORIENTATION=-